MSSKRMMLLLSDIIKGMKKTSKNISQKKLRTLTAMIAAIILITVVTILFLTNYIVQINSQGLNIINKGKLTDSATSTKNLALMRKATSQQDAKICDQISGAINYTNPNEEKREGSLLRGVSIITSAMTESEAKEQCYTHVRDLISRDNYKSEVCRDKNITHYEFNGVRFSCPEE
jgi:hypothetical protein